MTPSPRRPVRLLALTSLSFGLTLALAALPSVAVAQLPSSEEQLKILTDPESVKKQFDKDKSRPPIELFRTQVAPFDVLPYVKANHWCTVGLELRANYSDYAGLLQTSPVSMIGLPQEIVYRRDARLAKTQRSKLGFQMLMPAVPKEIGIELIRDDAVRANDVWQASLRVLEQDQMLIVFLTKETSDAYSLWNRYQALYPISADRSDLAALDKKRYYRLVQPLDPDKPSLSPHPLTWTTISHVVWDSMSPDTLNPGQQQAMLDWLHWGGQLTIVGGAGPSFSTLQDSFLSSYLPADVTGENLLLKEDDLKPLSEAFRPPYVPNLRSSDDENTNSTYEDSQRLNRRYLPPAPILPKANRPVYLAGLKPKAGAVGIALGDSGSRLIGVEQRVGRGRILMLGLSLSDPAIASWPGLDTLVRRVVLRRPEERQEVRGRWGPLGYGSPTIGPLTGLDLSWVRFVSRDLKIPTAEPPGKPTPPKATETAPAPLTSVRRGNRGPNDPATFDAEDAHVQTPEHAVAEWMDVSALPKFCRTVLEDASGIKIPNAGFVLKVILAYIIALVPLNWLICRYLLARRELAWVVVPMLSLGFAVGVERAAAYDLGYNSACDEIDVLESFGGYPRAHVSRFASLYSTGRTRFTVSYPNEPTALALPLDNGRSLRGEDVSTSVWQSFPVPSLVGYLVQPRSLSFFRAEEMDTLDGALSLVSEEGGNRKVVNGGRLEIRDAVLVDYPGGSKDRREIYLGTIGPGATVEVKEAAKSAPASDDVAILQHEKVLQALREDHEDRPENAGEIRLVGWAEKTRPGQKIEPPVDRHRGFTAVVVHLAIGPPPPPFGPIYDSRAKGVEPERQPSGTPAAGALSSNVPPGYLPGMIPGRDQSPPRKGRVLSGPEDPSAVSKGNPAATSDRQETQPR